MKTHNWELVIAKGDDRPGDSVDEVFYCRRCGTAKHDYRYGGGIRLAPCLYPVYFVQGLGRTINPPECVKQPPAGE